MEKKKAESPIFYLGERAESPILYIARQDCGTVGEYQFPTDDERLAGHVIPSCVSDQQGYLERLSGVLTEFGQASHNMETHAEAVSMVPATMGIIGVQAETAGDDIANFKVIPKLQRVYLDRKGIQLHERECFECDIVFVGGSDRKNGNSDFRNFQSGEEAGNNHTDGRRRKYEKPFQLQSRRCAW